MGLNIRYNEGAELILYGRMWRVATCLYADDAALFADSEEKLQRMLN